MTRKTEAWESVGDLASNDIIDSRDMEAKIDELEAIESEYAEWSTADPADRGEEPDKLDDDQAGLLKTLRETRDLCGREWIHGVAFIRESYWQRYCEDYAEDVGLIGDADKNPLWSCIDWEAWAEMMAQDYSQCEIDGTTFYYRD